MPAPGWKTANIEEDVYIQLSHISADLRRSLSWTASRILETAIQDCYGGHPKDRSAQLNIDIATKHGLV